jgi:capsular exopolysaccharide synthesis family protein
MRLPSIFSVKGDGHGTRRPADLLLAGSGDNFYAEKIKGLRAVVEQRADRQQLKVLGVTSSIAGEGKTLTCAKLGISLASTKRKKVLMVDVDIRKADLTQGMGAKRSPGLTDYLHGGCSLPEILLSTKTPDLFLVTTGAEVASPADLLAGDRFKTFLQEIRGQFDVILLDTPPVLPVADTPTIRNLADGFILLFRAGFTPYVMFRQAMEELEEKHILGAVLNGVEEHTDRYYQKYYGSYYHQKSMKAGPVG